MKDLGARGRREKTGGERRGEGTLRVPLLSCFPPYVVDQLVAHDLGRSARTFRRTGRVGRGRADGRPGVSLLRLNFVHSDVFSLLSPSPLLCLSARPALISGVKAVGGPLFPSSEVLPWMILIFPVRGGSGADQLVDTLSRCRSLRPRRLLVYGQSGRPVGSWAETETGPVGHGSLMRR